MGIAGLVAAATGKRYGKWWQARVGSRLQHEPCGPQQCSSVVNEQAA